MTDRRIVEYIITGSSAGAIRAMRQTEEAAKKTAASLEVTGSKLNTAGSNMIGFGRALTSVAVPLALVGGYAVKSAMGFQSAMTLIQTQAKASAGEVKRMSTAVLGLSGKVAESPEELAKALYPIESVGLRGTKALQALTAAAKGSQISGDGLTETANAMAGALKTGLPDVRSAAGAMSIMNGIVGAGKMKLEDLTGAMSTGILPQAKQVGLGFRDVGAAIASMTRQGVPAATEATRLRLNLTQMTAPSGQALKALQAIGLGQFSLAKDLRSPGHLIAALQDLRSHLKGLSKDQQDLILSDAFGKARGSANVIGLLNVMPMMEGIRSGLNKAGEAQLNSAFGTRSQNAAFKMQQALAQLKAGLVSLGNVLMPIVVPAMIKLAKVVREGAEWFRKLPAPVRDAGIYFGIFLVAAGPVLIFLGNLTKVIGRTMQLFGKLGPAAKQAAGEVGEETAAFDSAGGILGGAMSKGFGVALGIGLLFELNKHKDEIDRYLRKEVGGPFKAGANRISTGGMRGELNKKVAHWKYEQAAGVLAPLPPHPLTGLAQTSHELIEQFTHEMQQKRAEQAPTKVDVHLNGKIIAEAMADHIRDNASGPAARKVAEGTTKYALHRKATE